MTGNYFPTHSPGCNTCHLMVDLETLATHTSAPILAIGAVLFDPTQLTNYDRLAQEAILLLIDPADAVNTCGPVDGDTLRWWFRQDDAAIKRLVAPGALSMRDALIELWKYSHARITGSMPIPTHIWARSPDFDCAILQSACKATGVRYPFPFYKQRCVRTALDLAYPNGDPPKLVANGVVKHDARDDAVIQAMLIQRCYAELGLGIETPVSDPETNEVVRT